jgi:hypothetical protein
VSLARDYWQLVEPFCWSLQVAARWAEPEALQPWTAALRAIWRQAVKRRDGSETLIDLQRIPGLAATFTGAMATTGQSRWDNLKTLVVDTKVLDRYYEQEIPVVVAVHPWQPFRHTELTPHVLARSAILNQDLSTALEAYTSRRYFYRTPVHEWLHAVLRRVFDEQFLDDTEYDSAFDRTEAFLGFISEDQVAVLTSQYPDRKYLAQSKWFGRSTWRAKEGYDDPVREIWGELRHYKSAWAPLEAGLFGGDEHQAHAAMFPTPVGLRR